MPGAMQGYLGREEIKVKVTGIKVWVCPSCDEAHKIADEPLPVVGLHYRCGECEEVYEDRDDAKECCKE